jgi:acetoin:2,6-dichlorophenolindophenol oxidoreductase subunit alpha
MTTATSSPDHRTLLEIYRRMALIQANDERFRALIKAGKLNALYYSPRGQEAIPAAVSVHLRNSDTICTIYRGIHDMLAKGVPARLIWAEIAGRSTGTSKGKGGPMHVTHPESGVMITTGVVGSSMPIANGLALANQIRGDGGLCVAYFGDGASNIGAFHESLNLASVWKLPVIFVCQNNGYAEHTRYEHCTAAARIADRAAAYSMPGVRVDGNDPVAVWQAAGDAVRRARSGGGPTLIEALTFRFQGHVLGDADAYMDPAEKAAALTRDPVPRFRAGLLQQAVVSEGEIEALESAITREVDEAVEFALSSPYPEVAELRRDVYAEELFT